MSVFCFILLIGGATVGVGGYFVGRCMDVPARDLLRNLCETFVHEQRDQIYQRKYDAYS